MQKRFYGNTGKEISVIGFGGMRFLEDDIKKGLEKCADLVVYAKEKGITYFDTAPTYCDNLSESIFGIAFKSIKREDIIVSTKCALGLATSKQGAKDVVKRSLERMNIDKIDILHSWCIKTLEEYNMFFTNGFYDAFQELKEEKLVDVISFSTHMNGADIAKVANDGRYSGTLLGYNAINFAYREEGVEALAKNNKGIVIMNPLGGGFIPKNQEKFSFLKNGEDDAVLASLKFLTSQQRITSVICGFTNESEIDFNIKASENLENYGEEYLQKVKEKLYSELNSVCTLCGYCKDCPKGIMPHKFMYSFNEKVLGRDNQAVLDEITMHFGIDPKLSSQCISCGKCEKNCTQKLPIIKRLEEISNF